jgi:hypothetical protein
MRKIIFIFLILSQIAFAQTSARRYEAELVKNPNKGGKDTREVNAVLVFEKDVLKIISRRKKEVFKEFNYADIKYVEHSYSKTPFFTSTTRALILTMLTGLPIFFGEQEKHWLTVVTENDFAVLKIENDNFRLLKMEFVIRKLEIENINENFQ